MKSFAFFVLLFLGVVLADECLVTHLLNGGFERKVVSTDADDWRHVEAMQEPNDVKWQTTSTDSKIKVVKIGYYEFDPAEGIQAASLSSGGAIFQDVVTTPGTKMFWNFHAMVKQRSEEATLTVGIGSPNDVQTQQTITAKDTSMGEVTGEYVVPAGQTVTRFLLTPVSGETIVDAIIFGTKQCAVGVVELSGAESVDVGSNAYFYVSLLTDKAGGAKTLSLTGKLPGHMACRGDKRIRYWKHQARATEGSVSVGFYPIGECVGSDVTVKVDPVVLREYIIRIPVKMNSATPQPHGFVLQWYGNDDVKSTAPIFSLPNPSSAPSGRNDPTYHSPGTHEDAPSKSLCRSNYLLNSGFETYPISKRKDDLGEKQSKWFTTEEGHLIHLYEHGNMGVPYLGGQQMAMLGDAGTMLYQDVETVPGVTLYWEINHITNSDSKQAKMALDIGDPTGTLQRVKESTANFEQWAHYSGEYVVPAGQTVTRFALVAVDGGVSFVDDLKFGSDSCLALLINKRPTSGRVGYTIVNGGEDVRNVVVEDHQPAGTECRTDYIRIFKHPLRKTTGGTCHGGVATFPLGDMPKVDVEYTAYVDTFGGSKNIKDHTATITFEDATGKHTIPAVRVAA